MKATLQILLVAVAFVALFAATSSTAHAQGPLQIHCQPHYGFSPSAYSSNRIPTPPYFAVHPPVYYSHPVRRTYGYSPFAYPGTVLTPEGDQSQPETIINPHVKPKLKADETGRKTAAAGVVVNPYVKLVRFQ